MDAKKALSVINTVTERANALTGLLEKVEGVLLETKTAVESARSEVEKARETIVALPNKVGDWLAAAVEELKAGVEAAAAPAEVDLKTEVETTLDDALATATASMEALAAHVGEGVLQPLSDELHQELNTLVDAMNDKGTALFEQIEEFTRVAEAGAGDVAEAVAQPVTDAISVAADSIREVLTQLVDDVIRAGVADPLQGQLREASDTIYGALDQIVDHVCSAIEGIENNLFAGCENSRDGRLATEAVLDSLRPVIDPLLDQMRRVEGLARSVGLA